MSNDPYQQNPQSTQPSNPYAPTSQLDSDPFASASNDAEAFRREHLTHEASVKSIGCLYYAGAVFGVLFGVIYLGAAAFGGLDPNDEVPIVFLLILGGFMLTFGLAQGYIAYGLRRLLPYARIGGIVLSAIGLLGFPIGTLISAYFLYLFVSHKGEVVFSDYYREVIRRTPHIQYKTSMVVKVLIGVLFTLIVVGVVAAFVTV